MRRHGKRIRAAACRETLDEHNRHTIDARFAVLQEALRIASV
jgi:hypothetical protein